MTRLLLLIPVFFLFSCSFSMGRNSCVQETRGALDIGSGTTKAAAVSIDTCKAELARVIWESSRPLGLKDDLLKNKRLSDEALSKAKVVVSEFVQELKSRGAIKISGVATMALREAPNGAPFIKSLSASSGIPIRVISQKEEAALGAVSARVLRPEVKSHVIWDIGGASAQWVFKSKSSTEFLLSDLASVSFKDRVLKEMGTKAQSPNPLGRDGLAKSERMARDITKGFDPKLVNSIHSSNGVALGIGGVHRYSILGNLKKLGLIEESRGDYTLEELKKAISIRYTQTDAEVGGEYASTDVTNMVLVYAQMKVLGIEKVEVAKGNLALGVVMQDLMAAHGANDL